MNSLERSPTPTPGNPFPTSDKAHAGEDATQNEPMPFDPNIIFADRRRPQAELDPKLVAEEFKRLVQSVPKEQRRLPDDIPSLHFGFAVNHTNILHALPYVFAADSKFPHTETQEELEKPDNIDIAAITLGQFFEIKYGIYVARCSVIGATSTELQHMLMLYTNMNYTHKTTIARGYIARSRRVLKKMKTILGLDKDQQPMWYWNYEHISGLCFLPEYNPSVSEFENWKRKLYGTSTFRLLR